MIGWFEEVLGVGREELTLHVEINELHRYRENIIKRYWSKQANILLKQFRKTSFKKVKNKKVYANFNDHYGTLSVKVLKPSRFYYKIMGIIYGLAKAE